MFSYLAEHISVPAQVSIIADVSFSTYALSSFVFLGLLYDFAHLQHLTQIDIPTFWQYYAYHGIIWPFLSCRPWTDYHADLN